MRLSSSSAKTTSPSQCQPALKTGEWIRAPHSLRGSSGRPSRGACQSLVGGWVQQQQQQQQQQIGAYVPARTLLGVGACRRRLSTDDNDDCYSVLGCREGLVTRAIGKYDVRQAGREEQAPDASHGRVSSTGHDRCRSVDDGWPPSTPRWSKATHASSWASTRERASVRSAIISSESVRRDKPKKKKKKKKTRLENGVGVGVQRRWG
ncbi:hypothetical protein IWX49DRAFT_385820 [Phyllosticta citricarpa]